MSGLFIDHAQELIALEEQLEASQELAARALILAAQCLEGGPPLLPSARRLHDSLQHVVAALAAVKAVNDSVVTGLMELFKAALEQESNDVGQQETGRHPN